MRFPSALLMLALLLPGGVAEATPQSSPLLPAEPQPPLVNRLFPDTSFDGESWRALLPIMLMNHEPDVLRRVVGGKNRDAAER